MVNWEAIGIVSGGFVASFFVVVFFFLKYLIPRKVDKQMENGVIGLINSKIQVEMNKLNENHFFHIEEQLDKLSELPERVARLETKADEAEKQRDTLFSRLNSHINGSSKK